MLQRIKGSHSEITLTRFLLFDYKYYKKDSKVSSEGHNECLAVCGYREGNLYGERGGNMCCHEHVITAIFKPVTDRP